MLTTDQKTQIDNNLLALSEPLSIDGKDFTHARKTTEPKVVHRIKATRFSKSEFGEENSDAVLIGVTAQVVEFGCVNDEMELIEPSKFDPMKLCENLPYRDLVSLQYLLGKPPKISSTPQKNSSSQPSEQSAKTA
ncbi:hypothetical protein HG263_05540 [Pseudoalteromonas sp. JBTF-M23]|uniref:Uncharacterized protein n=1 Tax=Pseudoalteromonas caenipelagi TaxID=2726988 RepID=A0A849V8V6_9GAMM|nr:hypothetical protein [Pseudoalteromonas caenipelagi]NOU49999.1 hypothetical protein [Pseudoalteromonas caenipelagi]